MTSKKFQFLIFFSVKDTSLRTFFFVIYELIIHVYFKKSDFLEIKYYILIILADFYASLLRFFLLPGFRIHVSSCGSGSGQIIRIRNTGRLELESS